MDEIDRALNNLAAALVAGKWDQRSLTARARRAIDGRPHWLKSVLTRIYADFSEPPTGEDGVAAVRQSLERHRDTIGRSVRVSEYFWVTPVMHPSPWDVPAIPTTGAVAEWLGIAPTQLDSFTGQWREGPIDRRHHYRYVWRERRGGSPRLLECPKVRLKTVQRRILDEIIAKIPPHDAAYGFRPGRSVVSYAAPHTGKAIVVRFDLRSFFPSIRWPWVRAVFATAGYPDAVARCLAAVCTHRTPRAVRERSDDSILLSEPHLPQGAPTSPALANLCAYRLDVRLAALAGSLGMAYTRYADDLAFSSEMGEVRRLSEQVTAIAADEGFVVRATKTRVMRRGGRQHLAGVVVNERPNIRRADYDILKAVLTNSMRHGPASQNRAGHADFRSHLRGRIAHVARLNPERGRKLLALWERVEWSEGR